MTYKHCNETVNEYFERDDGGAFICSPDLTDDETDSETDIRRETEEHKSQYKNNNEEKLNDESSDLDESDKNSDEDVEVNTFLSAKQIEDLIRNEGDIPENVKTSRYYRRAKKSYFLEITESKTVTETVCSFKT